jgi:hypothetical protein
VSSIRLHQNRGIAASPAAFPHLQRVQGTITHLCCTPLLSAVQSPMILLEGLFPVTHQMRPIIVLFGLSQTVNYTRRAVANESETEPPPQSSGRNYEALYSQVPTC